MTTDQSLTESISVRKLQTILHVKAKEEPNRRFHALIDKVWRLDFLLEAWKAVRANGGAAGVDGQTIADIEAYGVEQWLRELSEELREGTYRPRAVRQVMIPKKQPGKFRPLGIPCLRDRVAQTSAMLVLIPIFEADLQPEQFAYRAERSAKDAVQSIHRLLCQGYQEVVDGDLSNYFGEIPHVELMKSLARRISDGRLLALLKAWLEMPVAEDDGKGGQRLSNRARKERKGTPQGAPISPWLSNIYMRRFIFGWKMLGYARKFQSVIVNYADDFCVLGKAPAKLMLAAVCQLMKQLKLPVNEQKTKCLRCPEEPLEFLGYRIGWNHRPRSGSRYIGTRPSPARVQSICRKVSEAVDKRMTPRPTEEVITKLNQILTGWANYFNLGQVAPVYRGIDAHTSRRLRQWFWRKHKVKSGHYVRFSDEQLRNHYGWKDLMSTLRNLPWAKRDRN